MINIAVNFCKKHNGFFENNNFQNFFIAVNLKKNDFW